MIMASEDCTLNFDQYSNADEWTQFIKETLDGHVDDDTRYAHMFAFNRDYVDPVEYWKIGLDSDNLPAEELYEDRFGFQYISDEVVLLVVDGPAAYSRWTPISSAGQIIQIAAVRLGGPYSFAGLFNAIRRWSCGADRNMGNTWWLC